MLRSLVGSEMCLRDWMGFARNVSSKTVFMENGVVVEQAPSQQFFASPKEERTRAFLRRIAHTE